MSYRNKTYVVFDGADIHYYRLMQAWKENDHIDFDFHNAHDIGIIRTDSEEASIKRRLRERFANSKQIIVLVGENTKHKHKYVRWEIEVAQGLDLPIIVVNLNKKRQMDDELCPAILKNSFAVHVSFNRNIIKHALDNWPSYYHKHKSDESGAFYYEKQVYDDLGL